jgi:nucleoid-associated protein YgaU
VRPQPSTRLVSTAPPAGERTDVVVRRGDTLWDLVRHHLGPDATDAEVAAEWPRWYEANRAVIGPDPGLLLPGQVLRAPATTGALR